MIYKYDLEIKKNKLNLAIKRRYNYENINNIDRALFCIVDINKTYKAAIEKSYVLAFKNSIFIGFIELGIGDNREVTMPLSTAFKFLLLSDADEFVIAHSHPVGCAITPSEGDLVFHSQVKYISDILNIKLSADAIIQSYEWYDMLTKEVRYVDDGKD